MAAHVRPGGVLVAGFQLVECNLIEIGPVPGVIQRVDAGLEVHPFLVNVVATVLLPHVDVVVTNNGAGTVAAPYDDVNACPLLVDLVGKYLVQRDAIRRVRIIGRRIVDLLTTPLLSDFLNLARQETDSWANVLVSRVAGILTDRPPDSWTITVSREETPAIIEMLEKVCAISLGMLCTDPRDVTLALPCVPLLLKRRHEGILVPGNETVLQPDDQLLFCGRHGAQEHMRWTSNNFNALNFICTGNDNPTGYIWRRLSGHPLT